MLEYIFKDQEAPSFELVPDGDYILEVIGYESLISNYAGTRGSPVIGVKVKVEGRNASWKEQLTLHPDWDWKVDVFLKCMNAAPAKGGKVNLSEQNLMGLRGWATVSQREYKATNGQTRKANKVVAWITNKQKLPRRSAEPEPEPFADVPF